MQFVFAAHVPVERRRDASGPGPEDGFKQTVEGWAKGRFGIDIIEWLAGQAEVEGAKAEWVTLEGATGRLTRLAVTHADAAGPWDWRLRRQVRSDGSTPTQRRRRRSAYDPSDLLVQRRHEQETGRWARATEASRR
jgi:hypothetical protein